MVRFACITGTLICLISFGITHVANAQCDFSASDVFDECVTDDDSCGDRNRNTRKALFDWVDLLNLQVADASAEESEEEEEGPLDLDRPDFTEASTTVGRGRVVLEWGYTFTKEAAGGTSANGHSFPEMLLRVGMFADWFELRVGQNFGTQSVTDVFGPFSGGGAEDLYLGTKLQLFEQQGWFPEAVLIPQMTVPTGSSAFSARGVMPGVNCIYGWEVTKWLGIGASSQVNRAPNTLGQFYAEFAQTFVADLPITEKLGAYVEWFAFFPHGANDPAVGPAHYADGGLAYLVNNNFQLDVRVGVGLNSRADNFFTGAGGGFRW